MRPLPAASFDARLRNLDTLTRGVRALTAHVPMLVEQTARHALIENERETHSMGMSKGAEGQPSGARSKQKSEGDTLTEVADSHAGTAAASKRAAAAAADALSPAKKPKKAAFPKNHLYATKSGTITKGRPMPAALVATRCAPAPNLRPTYPCVWLGC